MGKQKKTRVVGKKWAEDVLRSEYCKEYTEKAVPYGGVVHKYHEPLANGPFQADSTYVADYKEWEDARRGSLKPVPAPKDVLPFNALSSYTTEFNPKEINYARVVPAPHVVQTDGPFDGMTSNKENFKDWGKQKPRTPQRASSQPRPALPFDSSTLYKDDFKKWPITAKDPIIRPPTGGVHPKAPLDPLTTYGTTYVPKAGELVAAFRPKQGLQSQDWVDGPPSTEYKGHFGEKALTVTLPLKPSRNGTIFPVGAFDGGTNYSLDFQKWTAKPPRSLKPMSQSMDAKPFSGLTTYNDQFVKKDVPYERVRPFRTVGTTDGPFDPMTTNKADYKDFGPQGPVTLAKGPRHTLQNIPFEGATTYTDEFKPRAGERPGLIRAKSSSHETGPLDGLTIYKRDFVPKEIPVEERRNRYQVEDEDDDDL